MPSLRLSRKRQAVGCDDDHINTNIRKRNTQPLPDSSRVEPNYKDTEFITEFRKLDPMAEYSCTPSEGFFSAQQKFDKERKGGPSVWTYLHTDGYPVKVTECVHPNRGDYMKELKERYPDGEWRGPVTRCLRCPDNVRVLLKHIELKMS